MKLSERGIEFLKHAEGFHPCIYEDAGKYAIGYGCQVDYATWRDREIDKSQAESLMLIRLREFEAAVTEAVKMPLHQHQADAVLLLAYNIPPYQFQRSTLVKLLNQGKIHEAAEQFPRWIYSEGKEHKGLKARRELERRIFLGEPVAHYEEAA